MEHTNLQKVIQSVFTSLREKLVLSYGPHGGSAIIHNNGELPVVTKDGLTILRSIREFGVSEENYAAAYDIYLMVKSISDKLVSIVGDGSTSAVLASTFIYERLYELLGHDIFPTKVHFNKELEIVQEAIDAVSSTLFRGILNSGSPESISILTSVATLSNNNNYDIGKAIAEIVHSTHHTATIRTEINPLDNSPVVSLKRRLGFYTKDYKIAHSSYYAILENKKSFTIVKPKIIFANDITPDFYTFLNQNVLATSNGPKSPIVLFTQETDKTVLQAIIQSLYSALSSKHIPPFFLFTIPNSTSSDFSDNISNLEAFLDASLANGSVASTDISGEVTDENEKNLVISMRNGGDYIGTCESLTIHSDGGIYFEHGKGAVNKTKRYVNAIESIKKDISEINPNSNPLALGKLKLRLTALEGNSISVMVGGRTHEEKKSLNYLIEDSILACQSVMNQGVTVGNNSTPYYSILLLLNILWGEEVTVEKLEAIPEELANGREALIAFKTFLLNTDAIIVNRIKLILEALLSAYSDLNEFTLSTVGLKEYKIDPEFKYTIDDLLNNNITVPVLNQLTLTNEVYKPSDKFSKGTEVLTPFGTDKEILNSSISIATLLLSSNNYISS